MMIGRCMQCAQAAYGDRPGMFLCKARGTQVNSTFADAYHECFVEKSRRRTELEEF